MQLDMLSSAVKWCNCELFWNIKILTESFLKNLLPGHKVNPKTDCKKLNESVTFNIIGKPKIGRYDVRRLAGRR